jgi:hypothetical protein
VGAASGCTTGWEGELSLHAAANIATRRIAKGNGRLMPAMVSPVHGKSSGCLSTLNIHSENHCHVGGCVAIV